MSLLSLLQAAGAMNPKSEAMPGQIMEPKTPDFGDLSDPTLRNSRQNYLDVLESPPQLQAPGQPVTPALRGPDAIMGLLALISAATGGKKGGELASGMAQGWLGAKMQKAQQDTQAAQQGVQFQNQQAAQDYNTRANVAKAQLGFAEEDVNKADREKIRQENIQLKQEQDKEKALNAELNAVMRLYASAKTEQDMRTWAAKWADVEARQGAKVSTAPNDQDIKATYMQKSNAARNIVYDNWRQYVADAKKDNYSMVLPGEAARLNRLKKQFEDELRLYGIEDAYLPEPPTEKSKKAEYMEQMKSLAAQRQIAIKADADLDILKHKADIQYKREKLAIERGRLAMGNFNADTHRMSYELRRDISQANKKVDGKIQQISARIQGLRDKQAAEKSPSKRKQIEVQIQGLDGERKYWDTQREPDLGLTTPSTPGESSFSTPKGNRYEFRAD